MTKTQKFTVTALALICVLLSHLKTFDQHGLAVTESGLSRALVTFGVSRGLNGVISVVQGTEVAVEPVGIGMTFTPGQILDPVNDLVERFSTIVLVSGTAFGVQRVALEVTANSLYLWLTTFVVLLALGLLWTSYGSKWVRHWCFKAALLLVLVRFAVPIVALASDAFYVSFLEPQFIESTEQLKATSSELGEMQAATQMGGGNTSQPGLLESAKRWMKSAGDTLDVKQHIEDFRQAAETISEHAVRLMVVFLFQTIILPLVSVWVLLRLLRSIMSANFSAA